MLTCSGATGTMVVNIWSGLWVGTINERSYVASYRGEGISQRANVQTKNERCKMKKNPEVLQLG
jgi:hypothetical protein